MINGVFRFVKVFYKEIMASLKLTAYNIIKQKIIQCEYPPNCLLNEEMLREELQVSRTPIRDALSRLEQESLIHILPKRGIVVAGLRAEDAEQIFELRLLIEPYAVERYGPVIQVETYKKFAESFATDVGKLKQDEIFAMDDDFHYTFITAANNTYLNKAYQFSYTQNIRFRILSGSFSRQRLEKSQAEHLRITRCCLKKEWEAAAEAQRKHLMNAKEMALNTIKAFPAAPGSLPNAYLFV
jgi:DNA-binding GntR family transcriptional regulator